MRDTFKTKIVKPASTPDEREAFIRLMVEVKGPHYAIGHMTYFYRNAKLSDTDESVMDTFRQELLEEKFLSMVDKKDVDTVTS